MTSNRLILALATTVLLSLAISASGKALDYSIKLKSGDLAPRDNLTLSAASVYPANKHIMLQFAGPITPAQKQSLESAGVSLHHYIPNYTYVAKVDHLPDQRTLEALGVRWIGPISPEQKLAPDISYGEFRDYSLRPDNRVEMTVTLHEDIDPYQWTERLITDFSGEIIGVNPLANAIDVILPLKAYLALAELDDVFWLEQALPEPKENNNNSRSYTGAETLQASPYNLDGDGVIVAEWDGGRANSMHRDLQNRTTELDGSAISVHATHVAGTILGTGVARTDLRYRGMAPGARLLTQLWWGSGSELVNEYDNVINNYDARVSTNSWGYGINPITSVNCGNTLGTYGSVCRTIDNLVRGQAGEPISIVWSAGNERSSSSESCGSIGWTYNTIGLLATSKNIITVGAVSAYTNSMTSFSSWGPTDDGRIKPDICGPGSSVTSCNTTITGYTTMSGTSMSAPAVAGLLALMYEQNDLSFGLGASILPSTMKGIMINTAVDMGRVGPDYSYGHGKVDVEGAVNKLAAGDGSWIEGELATSEVFVYDLTVPGNADRLKVTIVWDDPGGTVSASEHLINNIDLELIDPFGAVVLPWALYPANPSWSATRGVDNINNVETVEIDNPVAGLWKARVTGSNIPDGPQKYSLIFTPDAINTPGNLTAVAVFDDGDLVVDPSVTIPVEFWITNVGASDDSFTVSIDENIAWVVAALDTTVALAPYDSAYILSSATVPASALAGDATTIICRAASLTDTLAVGANALQLSASQIFAATVATNVVVDTVNSPDTFDFQVTLNNTGNGDDIFVITPTGAEAWTFSPAFKNVIMAYQLDTVLNFQAIIPAEVIHLSDNTVNVTAVSSGGPESLTSFNLIGNNPFFPPQLLAPAPPVFTQDGTPLFEWSSDGDSYNLYLATDTLMNNIVRTITGISGTSFTLDPADSLTDGFYFWSVRKYIGADSSSLQRYPFKLAIDNLPPNLLEPSSPVNKYLVDGATDLYWVNKPGETVNTIAPEFNILQYASDENFTTDLTTINPLAGYLYTPDPFGLGRWYWRVQRADSAGNFAAYSETATFVIDNEAPQQPNLLLPEQAAAVSGDTLLLTWSIGLPPAYETAPDYFYLHVAKDMTFSDYSTFANFVYNDTIKLTTDRFDEFEDYFWRVKAFDSAGHFSDYSEVYSFTFGEGICGDFDGDAKVNLADITALIAFVYISGLPPIAESVANVNCDDKINLADITTLIDHIYISKNPMCCSAL